jgi:hypothetical protein
LGLRPYDDEGGEVIAGVGEYDVRVAFADDHIAIVLVAERDSGFHGNPGMRAELTRENALRLSVELELAASSLAPEPPLTERRRGPADRRRRRARPTDGR